MVTENSDSPTLSSIAVQDKKSTRKRRKVADDILHAFHFACDTRDFEIAQRLLVSLENLLLTKVGEQSSDRSRALASFVAAHERLWTLRQPAED